MSNLQRALSINALFSGASGILFIITHKWLAKLFDLESSTPFWVTGIVLLFFAGTIVWEVYKQRPLPVLWIIVQDFLWVIGSGLLLAIRPFGISATGNVLIAVVALTVLLMALLQGAALAKIDRIPGKSRKQFSFERTVKASKKEVWEVISDVANYHTVAPNIDTVKIISGKGKGMLRSCSHGKDSWTESCSAWEEERSYSFEVNTAAPDYPYPLNYLKGSWGLLETDANASRITMTFEFQYKYRVLNVLLHPFLRAKFKKTSEKLLDNWQVLLEKDEKMKEENTSAEFRYSKR